MCGISYDVCDVELPDFNQNKTEKWILAVVERYGKEVGELNYFFCSDNYLLEMNKEHLNHNYFTDIITFDYTVGDIISGDLFISIDTVKDNAQTYSVSFAEEFNRVIIHGVLHLIGFNDKTDAEQEEMTHRENESLALITAI